MMYIILIMMLVLAILPFVAYRIGINDGKRLAQGKEIKQIKLPKIKLNKDITDEEKDLAKAYENEMDLINNYDGDDKIKKQPRWINYV